MFEYVVSHKHVLGTEEGLASVERTDAFLGRHKFSDTTVVSLKSRWRRGERQIEIFDLYTMAPNRWGEADLVIAVFLGTVEKTIVSKQR